MLICLFRRLSSGRCRRERIFHSFDDSNPNISFCIEWVRAAEILELFLSHIVKHTKFHFVVQLQCCTDICRIRRSHRRANVIVRFSSNDFIDVFIHILLTMQLVYHGIWKCSSDAVQSTGIVYNALQFRNDFVECNAKPNEQRTNWPSFAYMYAIECVRKYDFGRCFICYFPKWRRSTFYCSVLCVSDAAIGICCNALTHTHARQVNGVEFDP